MCIAIIEDWVTAGGTSSHLKVLTAIVRDAGHSIVLDHEGFVGRTLRLARSIDREMQKDLFSAIFAASVTGGRLGVLGQPFDADVRLKKLTEERLERITRADPTYNLYLRMRDHAAHEIERQLADGRRMDEEDADA